jgi:beta-glucanase (GH16 family)
MKQGSIANPELPTAVGSQEAAMSARALSVVAFLGLASACTWPTPIEQDAGTSPDAADAASADTGAADSGHDDGLDAGPDDGLDAGPAEEVDSGAASRRDAGRDAGVDAGHDTRSDAGSDGGPGRPKPGDVDSKGRVLTFADEFDGPQIDRNVWGNETGLVRNDELQCYTTDAKNQFIENGDLVIRGIHESACGGTYTSASLTTEGHQSFKYGLLEARIRVPSAKGSWPAFWLLPANKAKYGSNWWPAGGEVDILEVVSQTSKTVYGTAHYQQNSDHGSSGKSIDLSASVSADYHVFAIEWTSTQIDWFVDGVHYHSFDTTQDFDGFQPFQESFYAILNFAIGGSWPEAPDAAKYPDEMRVDWIRYWKPVN